MSICVAVCFFRTNDDFRGRSTCAELDHELIFRKSSGSASPRFQSPESKQKVPRRYLTISGSAIRPMKMRRSVG